TNIRGPEGANTELKSGSGSRLNKADVVFTQGTPYYTGKTTDFAITGEGFFAVQFEDENLFTRGGSFQITNIDDDNYLTYQGGYVLNSEEEPIIIENPDDVINVGVFIFNNNNDLEQAGNNLFRIANEDAEYEMDENAKLMKGYVEGSNVDLSEEMVKLIQIQKSFQLNSSIIRTADEIEQTINSLRG
ncbi:flagellar basal body rod C-terminal domain-containing protein, partial [Sedimentibacter sp.]|uniref:flagellar hook-basal body protein n=1 Tax=Sedimentibacter sp. TaxID=1960295 RepID=UPI002899AC09